MSELDLLDELERWYETNGRRLRRLGMSASFGRGEKDRPKSVAWLNLQSSTWLGEILVWASGEVELGATRRDRSGDLIFEHHEITSGRELNELLSRLAALIRS